MPHELPTIFRPSAEPIVEPISLHGEAEPSLIEVPWQVRRVIWWSCGVTLMLLALIEFVRLSFSQGR